MRPLNLKFFDPEVRSDKVENCHYTCAYARAVRLKLHEAFKQFIAMSGEEDKARLIWSIAGLCTSEKGKVLERFLCQNVLHTDMKWNFPAVLAPWKGGLGKDC